MLDREKRNTAPHVAIVNFNILVHRLLPDGSIDPQVVDCSDLFMGNYIAKQGQVSIHGFDKWDCVKNIKERLERLVK
jgi:hypothetical protein